MSTEYKSTISSHAKLVRDACAKVVAEQQEQQQKEHLITNLNLSHNLPKNKR